VLGGLEERKGDMFWIVIRDDLRPNKALVANLTKLGSERVDNNRV
jgi:hypothetical protein